MDSGLASASLRRPGITRLTKGDTAARTALNVALELGFVRYRQRIGALRERVVHFAGGAAPLGERGLHAPRALGDVQRLEENRRIVDHDFGLKKSAALDQAKALDHVQLFAMRRAEVVDESLIVEADGIDHQRVA